ncbi:extra-large guanine nucleotide-binding protein 1-like [Ipomoea triloba]|uniref:extra-large guanine nucleotide-binding protein 1-like n=1 Tax=Ipomoea triloba TaxID=35885 RepID=UPI00125D1856|nr:extra-large guanine nucleotide-binding protein 1-like [Ipomoea triloba]
MGSTIAENLAEVLRIQEFVDDSMFQENKPLVNSPTDSDDEEKEKEEETFPEKPAVLTESNKCFRCGTRNMFMKKEACIVCCAKYCKICVLGAMGSMPEGRKCIDCIGCRINETMRDSLGKCSSSGALKSLISDQEVKLIMASEISCKANQLPSSVVCVNGKRLSGGELAVLQSCPHPPKKMKPGRYWYDKVSGFWGKEGRKPCQIISPQLTVGDTIKRDASNGNTDVFINNREITKSELFMLKVIGIHCEWSIHFWLSADGAYQQEGMNNVMGKLWEKAGVKLVCTALSLPTPPPPN